MTIIAVTTVTAVPTDADALAGYTRVLETSSVAFLHERIAVADTAGVDFDADLAQPGEGILRSTVSNGPPGTVI